MNLKKHHQNHSKITKTRAIWTSTVKICHILSSNFPFSPCLLKLSLQLGHIFECFTQNKYHRNVVSRIPRLPLFACLSPILQGWRQKSAQGWRVSRLSGSSLIQQTNSSNQHFTLAPLLQGVCAPYPVTSKAQGFYSLTEITDLCLKTYCNLVHVMGESSVKQELGRKIQAWEAPFSPRVTQEAPCLRWAPSLGPALSTLCRTLSLVPSLALGFLWRLSCTSGPGWRSRSTHSLARSELPSRDMRNCLWAFCGRSFTFATQPVLS